MPYSAGAYLQQLKNLLPRGALWNSLREDGALFSELLAALAEEPSRIDASASSLPDEADPRTTLQLLQEWEAFAGLPDTCSGQGATTDARREALLAALTALGGQSRAYYIALAESLGFPGATITEYDPHTIDETVDAPIYGLDWQFAWLLTAPMPDVDQLTVDDTVDDSLGQQAATTVLECQINKTKPAHTTAQFNYS